MLVKQKVCSYYLGRGCMDVLRVDPCGVYGERVGCTSIQCTNMLGVGSWPLF